MIAVHELPYWKALRAQNMLREITRGLKRLQGSREKDDVIAVFRFLLWSRGKWDASLIAVIRGALLMALSPIGGLQTARYLRQGLTQKRE